MSQTLPSNSNLEQLKKQAKDLLKSHAAGKAEVCPTFRRLRKFANASEQEILSAPISLSEAQFALAMDYGFKSWPELKRHVETSREGKPVVELKTEEGGKIITGFEDVDWGRSRNTIDNSFIRCLTCALNAAGEDVTYAEMMGFSGAAFRVQVAQPEFCPSAACSAVGFDCCGPALQSVGYRMDTIHILVHKGGEDWEEADAETLAKARKAVVETIDKGRPALYSSEEDSLLVGYRDGGNRFVVRAYWSTDKPGYVEAEKLPWMVGFLGEKRPIADRREVVVGSLRRALELANTAKFDNCASGFAAYNAWISALQRGHGHLDEKQAFGWILGNAYCYWTLYNSREAAAEYLRSISDELDEDASPHLLRAADLYDRLQNGLHTERACAPYPWWITEENPWTDEQRARETQLLRQALEMDRQAFAEIEQALKILE